MPLAAPSSWKNIFTLGMSSRKDSTKPRNWLFEKKNACTGIVENVAQFARGQPDVQAAAEPRQPRSRRSTLRADDGSLC